MKLWLTGLCLWIGTGLSFAYWVPTAIEQLATDSDCVVIGRVTSLRPNTNTLRVQITMSDLTAVKGSEFEHDTITFEAPYTLNSCVVFTMKADDLAGSVKPSTSESNGALITTMKFSLGLPGIPPQTVVKPSTWRSNELVITHLNSFQTNEVCAVFLKRDPDNARALKLVTDSDGKFSIDWESQKLWRSVMAGSKDQNAISLDQFRAAVRAGDKLPKSPTVTVTTNWLIRITNAPSR